MLILLVLYNSFLRKFNNVKYTTRAYTRVKYSKIRIFHYIQIGFFSGFTNNKSKSVD